MKKILGVKTIKTLALIFVFSFVFATTLFSLPEIAKSVSNTLFYSGMELGKFRDWASADRAWAQSGKDYVCESKSATVKKTGGDSDLTSFPINTIGYTNLKLNYWFKITNKIDWIDYVRVQWSSDGTTWHTLKEYSQYEHMYQPNWANEDIPLPVGAENQPNLKIRVRAHITGSYDIFHLDCVKVTGTK